MHQCTNIRSFPFKRLRSSSPWSRSDWNFSGTVTQTFVRIEMALSRFPLSGSFPTDSCSLSRSPRATVISFLEFPARTRLVVYSSQSN